jgi:hypothetical protein
VAAVAAVDTGSGRPGGAAAGDSCAAVAAGAGAGVDGGELDSDQAVAVVDAEGIPFHRRAS